MNNPTEKQLAYLQHYVQLVGRRMDTKGEQVNKTFYLREGRDEMAVLTKKPGLVTEHLELCGDALDFLELPKVLDTGKIYRVNVTLTELA